MALWMVAFAAMVYGGSWRCPHEKIGKACRTRTTMSKARTLIAGLLCALLHTPFAAAVPTYVLHEIPIEEGLSGRQTANGINEDGSVVGNLITSPDYAFIWSQATGATYFNHAGPAGGEWGASDINDNELVTANSCNYVGFTG